MRLDGTHVQQLTHIPGGAGFAEFGPEGKRIAFAGIKGGDTEIFTIKPNGTHLNQLTHNHVDDFAPAFSPNGAKIAFQVGVNNQRIFTMSVGGGNRHKISNDGRLPDWQPIHR